MIAWSAWRKRFLGENVRMWRQRLGFAPNGPLEAEELEKICVMALGGTVDGYAARIYYP